MLAEKLLTLIDDPQKRKIIAKEAYKYAQEQTWEKIFLRLFKRYNEIINQYHLSGIRAA